MANTPLQPRSDSRQSPGWHRWVLNALYYFDRRTIADWVGLMNVDLQRPAGVRAMQTARYTVDALRHVGALKSAIASRAAHGDTAARSQLSDAALDLKCALDRLHVARDQLLKAAGAERVTDAD